MRYFRLFIFILMASQAWAAGDRDRDPRREDRDNGRPGRENGPGNGNGRGHGHGHARIPRGRDDTAGGRNWKGHQHDGDACQNGIAVIVNGYTLSVLFDDFDVDFPMGDPGGDGMQKRKFCHFSVDLTPPDGTYLTGFRQVFTGGMIKSKGAQAKINIQYRFGGPAQNKDIQWRQGDSISPDSPLAVFSQVFDDVIPPRNRCKETQRYDLRLELQAQRRDRTDYMQGGLDTLDAEAMPSVSIVPQWKPCR